MTELTPAELRAEVRARYGEVARAAMGTQPASCCGTGPAAAPGSAAGTTAG